MPPKARSALSLILKLGFAAGLIVFLVRSGNLDLSKIWDLMTPLNVAVGLGLLGLNVVTAAWRWIVLLNSRGFKISFGHGLSLYFIGMFFNYALPGSVSGDLVKGYYLVQDYPGRKMDAALSVLIDRVLGVYSFFILTLIAVSLDLDFVMSHEQIRAVSIISLLVFLGMTGFFFLAFSESLYKFSRLELVISKIKPLHALMEGFQRFGKGRKTLAASLLISLLAQGLSMVFFYVMGIAMADPDVTWKAVLFAVPMGSVAQAVPIAPAGLGVGQVVFLYLFQIFMNKTTQFGAISITAYQLAVTAWSMVGVIFYLRLRKPHELENLQTKMEAVVP